MKTNSIYLHKKWERATGKYTYALETKTLLNGKQVTVHLLTIPPFNSLLELITGEVAEDYIRKKIEKKQLVAEENKCQDKPVEEIKKDNPNVRLIDIARTATNTPHKPTDEELKLLWEMTKE